jgi:transglutaminase-like putative cysteine protease
MTVLSAVAVLAASFSLFSVIGGAGWLYAGAGAAVAVAGAGLATRLPRPGAAAVATGLVTIAVIPALASGTWEGRVGGAVLIAAMAGSGITRRVLPSLADAGTYLAALFLYLNLAFAAGQSWGWIIPTGRSAHRLAHLAQLGYGEHIYAPPVPGIRGLELVAAAGIGIIAILTDLITVRLRSPAVAGLPLLVLFSVPVATNLKDDGLGLALAFCVGITGYLALLTADGRERLRLWGRLVTVWQQTPEEEDSRGPDTRALAASGRRIGLAAVVLAVVVPLALPISAQRALFGKTATPGGTAGTGGSAVAAPQPLVAMSSDLHESRPVPLLSYRTNAPQPRQQYLQVYVLTDFNAARQQFSLAGRGPSIAFGAQQPVAPPGLISAGFETVRTTVTIAKDDARSPLSYLPVPYAPQALTDAGSGWREDKATLMLYGFRPDNGLRYTIVSKVPNPSQTELITGSRVPGSVRSYLAYDGPDKAQLTRIAGQITAGAKTPFQKGLALENYFTRPGSFTYSLGPGTATSVTQFLTTDKRGFCQQFATAMAVLARLAGVPSRLAVGFTAGTQVGRHQWQVTTADAHAWPELYIPGAGWLRFEPTPGGPSAQGTAIRPAYAGVQTGPSTAPLSGPSASIGPGGKSPTAPAGIKKPIPEGQGGPLHHGTGRGGGFPVGWLVAVIIVALAVTPALSRLAVRQRRWLRAGGDAQRAHAAWRELTGDLDDYGLGGPASESPRALAQRVASMSDLDLGGRQAVTRIAAAEERARYARAPGSSESLQADARAARRAVSRAAPRGQRWRARLLPASVLHRMGAGLRGAADVVGWLEAAGLRARRAG